MQQTTIESTATEGLKQEVMLQLMINASLKPEDAKLEKITAHAFFFFAGFEIIGALMILEAHAMDPEIRARLQDEIDQVINGNDPVIYEKINQLRHTVSGQNLHKEVRVAASHAKE